MTSKMAPAYSTRTVRGMDKEAQRRVERGKILFLLRD
jgi:hypothetical protein